MGRGKNAPKNLYIHKVLFLIEAELELLNLKIKHPEQFNLPVHAEFKSDLYVIPKSKDLGIIGIAEIVLGRDYRKGWKARFRGLSSPWLRAAFQSQIWLYL